MALWLCLCSQVGVEKDLRASSKHFKDEEIRLPGSTVAHTTPAHVGGAEARGSWVPHQPGRHSQIHLKKQNKKLWTPSVLWVFKNLALAATSDLWMCPLYLDNFSRKTVLLSADSYCGHLLLSWSFILGCFGPLAIFSQFKTDFTQVPECSILMIRGFGYTVPALLLRPSPSVMNSGSLLISDMYSVWPPSGWWHQSSRAHMWHDTYWPSL